MGRDEQDIVTFRLPRTLIQALDRWGKDEDRSRANLLARIVQDAVFAHEAESKKAATK